MVHEIKAFVVASLESQGKGREITFEGYLLMHKNRLRPLETAATHQSGETVWSPVPIDISTTQLLYLRLRDFKFHGIYIPL